MTILNDKRILTNIDFGKNIEVLIENKDEIIKKVNSLTNGQDILNYMTDKNWEYVDKQVICVVLPYVNNNIMTSWNYIYTFRKQKSE